MPKGRAISLRSYTTWPLVVGGGPRHGSCLLAMERIGGSRWHVYPFSNAASLVFAARARATRRRIVTCRDDFCETRSREEKKLLRGNCRGKVLQCRCRWDRPRHAVKISPPRAFCASRSRSGVQWQRLEKVRAHMTRFEAVDPSVGKSLKIDPSPSRPFVTLPDVREFDRV